jgi:integrase
VIDGCLVEPHTETDPRQMGLCPTKDITAKKIKRLRDLKKGLPGAANNRKKYLSSMFGWAVENDKMASNPAREVRKKRYAKRGFYTWTEAEVARFEEHHAIGTRARLALALHLYFGVRKSDVVRLGPKHIHESSAPGEPRTIRFVPKKTDYKRTRESVKPILPTLERILAATPNGEETFLVNKDGRPFSSKGYANTMRRWVKEAGLPKQYSSHGLRKVGATRCAEGGATEYQMMALFDWDTPAQATDYIKDASRKRMALGSAHMLQTPRVH